MTTKGPDKEKLRQFLSSTNALLGAMDAAQRSTGSYHIDNWVGYKQYATRFMELLLSVSGEAKLPSTVKGYDIKAMPSASRLLPHNQKMIFESVYTDLLVLKGFLENRIGVTDDELKALRDFLQDRLRSAVFQEPKEEEEVQNVVEQLLIGRGMRKGQDYDREVGRVKFSSKEVVPDFIVLRLSLALEIKLIKTPRRVRDVVDEINADIASYSKKYAQLLFLVYDLGHIRDEMEFRQDLESAPRISVLVVKQ